MGVTQEGALPQREAPKDQGWVANKLAQIWFRLDGILHHVKNDRYRDPDTQDDLRDLVAGAVREGARRATIEIDTYHEGGGGGWKDTSSKVIVGLLILGIASNVVQYAVVASLKQEVTDLRKDLDDLKKLVEPRYRGAE